MESNCLQALIVFSALSPLTFTGTFPQSVKRCCLLQHTSDEMTITLDPFWHLLYIKSLLLDAITYKDKHSVFFFFILEVVNLILHMRKDTINVLSPRNKTNIVHNTHNIVLHFHPGIAELFLPFLWLFNMSMTQ